MATCRSQNEYFWGTWMRRQTSGSVPVRTIRNWCTSFGRMRRSVDLLPIAGTLTTEPSVRRTALPRSKFDSGRRYPIAVPAVQSFGDILASAGSGPNNHLERSNLRAINELVGLTVEVRSRRGRAKTGGEAGIRTLGTGLSPYNGLANRRFRPLSHLTARGFPKDFEDSRCRGRRLTG